MSFTCVNFCRLNLDCKLRKVLKINHEKEILRKETQRILQSIFVRYFYAHIQSEITV